ncbi:MAG: FAD:protein FMN transferase [Gemmatimonadaceae bacterium]
MTDHSPRASRRTFLTLGAGALVVAALPLTSRRERRQVHRRTLPVMGTIAEVAVVHDDAARAQQALDTAFAELTRIDRLMTRYDAHSDVGRVNTSRVGDPVAVSAETAGVVLTALDWAVASDGAFDPAIEHVIAAWNVLERTSPPPASAYQRLAGRNLYRALELSTRQGRPVIVRRDPDVGIDLGAIAKGYAVDRAGEALRAGGVTDGVVRVGGDLVALGAPPDAEAWRIGIRSPASEHVLIGEVDVSNGAIATSGDYQRFFMYRGVRYHHLMDPATAAPRRTPMHSITVHAATCMHADAAATTCYGMERGHAQALLAVRTGRPTIVRTA